MTKSKFDPTSRPLIGWREWASLPDWGVDRINAKIDTGAKTSAIHAFRVKVLETEDGEVAEFYLHPRRRRKKPEIFCRTKVVDRRIVRSSNGQAEERIVVTTKVRMGECLWPIELTLTNRDAMGFRLLIGRDALTNRFMIDPGASYLLGKKSQLKTE